MSSEFYPFPGTFIPSPENEFCDRLEAWKALLFFSISSQQAFMHERSAEKGSLASTIFRDGNTTVVSLKWSWLDIDMTNLECQGHAFHQTRCEIQVLVCNLGVLALAHHTAISTAQYLTTTLYGTWAQELSQS